MLYVLVCMYVHPSILIYVGMDIVRKSNFAFKTGFPINGFTVKSDYSRDSYLFVYLHGILKYFY